MALTIKTETLKATTSPTFEALRNRYSHRSSDDEIAVDPLCLSRDDLNELLQACRGDGESKIDELLNRSSLHWKVISISL